MTFSSSSSLSSESSESSASSTSSSSSELKNTLPFEFRGIAWNKSKQLVSATAAINKIPILNQHAQAMKMLFDQYSIRYVACYLRRVGRKEDYDVILEIWNANDDGTPLNLLDSTQISASQITSLKWYNFDFEHSLEQSTPDNQYLVFIMYQNGGDDSNYVEWYYYPTPHTRGNIAYVSDSGGNQWVEQPQVLRIIKVSDAFDIFDQAYIDSEHHHIPIMKGDVAAIIHNGEEYLSSGTFENTDIITYDDKKGVAITYKPIVVSILVDNSGSMGWNDRYFDRKEVIKEVIKQFNEKYPYEVLFDITAFGSLRIGELDFASSATYATIKIGLRNPDNFTLNRDGSTPSISDPMEAFGFSQLEDEHQYIISTIKASPSETIIEDGLGAFDADLRVFRPINYRSLGNQDQNIHFAISTTKGPGESTAVTADITHENTTNINKTVANNDLKAAMILENIAVGQNYVITDNPYAFRVGTAVTIKDVNNVIYNLQIISTENIGGNYKLTFNTELPFAIANSFSPNGGFIQEYSPATLNISPEDTMIEILLKDPNVSRKVVFYLQSTLGGRMEWEIAPFRDWESMLCFYAHEYGNLLMDGTDANEEPLPNGTRIDLYVDATPSKIEETEFEFVGLMPPIKSGDNELILYENNPIVGDEFQVIDEGIIIEFSKEAEGRRGGISTHIVTDLRITEIPDPDDPIKTIEVKTATFTPVFSQTWDAHYFMIIDIEQGVNDNLKLNVPVSSVNITPVIRNKALPPEFLWPSDPPQLEPGDSLDEINQDREKKIDNVVSIPSIDGRAYIRVLPITVDELQTIQDQNSNTDGLYGQEGLTYEERVEQEKQNQAYLADMPDDDVVVPSVIDVEEITDIDEEKEYHIETPIYIDGGQANSDFTSQAWEMETISNPWFGMNYPYLDLPQDQWHISQELNDGKTLLVKKHDVYPYVSVTIDRKTIGQAMPTVPVYFATPIQIYSNITSPIKEYQIPLPPLEMGEPLEPTFKIVKFPVLYASENTSATIEYVVYHKGVLLSNGTLNVRIFDQTRQQIDLLNIDDSTSPDLRPIAVQYGNPPPIDKKAAKSAAPKDVYFSHQQTFYRDNPDILYINSTPNRVEATYLPGYPPGGYSLNIINGKCSFTISSTEMMKYLSHLSIEAEVVDPNNARRSTVRVDNMFLDNPLAIHPIINNRQPMHSPSNSISATFYSRVESGDNKTYNIGGQLKWMCEIAPDNIPLELQSSVHKRYVDDDDDGEWPATPIYPSVSKTTNGIAVDCYIGEHGEVTSHYVFRDRRQIKKGDIEYLTLTSSWRGMGVKETWALEWMGPDPEPGETIPTYISTIIYKNGERSDVEFYNCTDLFADGWDYAIAVADLPTSHTHGDAETIETIKPWLCGEIKNTDGISQPRTTKFTIEGRGKILHESSGIWTANKPSDPMTGKPLELLTAHYPKNMGAWLISSPISASFIPIPPDLPSIKCPFCDPDKCTLLIMRDELKIDNNKFILQGCAATEQLQDNGPCKERDPITGETVIIHDPWRAPKIHWKEPLDGELTLMHESPPYTPQDIAMDGTTKTFVEVNVHFSGLAIPIVARQRHVIPQFDQRDSVHSLISYGKLGGSWTTVGAMSESHAVMEQYMTDMWYHYTDILKQHKEEQQGLATTADQSLLFAKRESVEWVRYFPYVTFDLYLADVTSEEIYEGNIEITKSNIRRPAFLSLTQPHVLLSLNKTSDKYPIATSSSSDDDAGIVNNHYHTCFVNEAGMGHTTETYATGTLQKIENHEHTIEAFEVRSAYDIELHDHILKSTAFTYINPFTVQDWASANIKTGDGKETPETKLWIEAYLQYDASKTFVERELLLSKSFSFPTNLKEMLWILELKSPSKAFASVSTSNNDDNFGVQASLFRRTSGGKVYAPDGTRIQITMSSFATDEYLQRKIEDVVVLKESQPYMIVKFIATASIEGQNLSAESETMIISKLPWLPTIKKLTPRLTSNELYLEQAIEKIECIGGSPMYDGILQSLSVLKKHYMDNIQHQHKHFITLLLSDGEENNSINSNIHDLVENLEQSKRFPVYPSAIGSFVTNIGQTILNIIAQKSTGKTVSTRLDGQSEILEYVLSVLQNQDANAGLFYRTIDINNLRLWRDIIYDFNIPDNAKILASFRLSSNMNDWTLWSPITELTATQDRVDIQSLFPDQKYRYLQYRLQLMGSENFESPVYFGNRIRYLEPFVTTLLLQPIEFQNKPEERISELMISPKIQDGDLIEAQYGFTYADSTKESDYFNFHTPSFQHGIRQLVLSRINEPLETNDFYTYRAINGAWAEICDVEVYQIINPEVSSEKILIQPHEYTIYPDRGEIRLNVTLNEQHHLFISLNFPHEFRLMCKFENHSDKTAYLDHMGVMYNVANPKLTKL